MQEYVLISLFFITLAVTVPKSIIVAGKVQRANYYPCRTSGAEWAEYAATLVTGLAAALAEYAARGAGIAILALAAAAGTIFYSVKAYKMRVKFRFTYRATRLYVLYQAMTTAASGAVFAFSATPAALMYAALVAAVSPMIMRFAAAVLLPFEKKNNARYLKKYAEKYREMKFIRIAVTGSFGKTAVKNMLYAALKSHYTVMMSEGNFNTPFGIVKSLEKYAGEQIFIAEFGARRKGDIEELNRLLPPDRAVITGVNEQHLETFGSVSAVAGEKEKLAAAVKEPSHIVFNGGNAYTAEMAKRYPGSVTAGEKGDVTAERITETEEGLRFYLRYGGERRLVTFPLHGKHNAYNAAMAAAVALGLGVPLKDIAGSLKRLTPVPHRFEVKKAGDITIIDDGYNSNIEGAESGAESLRAFPGRKVVSAAGIAEAGAKKRELNMRLGSALAGVADVVILSGENAKHIEKGLKQRGFSGEIIKTRGIAQTAKALPGILRPGDVVWFQNDIP